jgi:hypothetical protein
MKRIRTWIAALLALGSAPTIAAEPALSPQDRSDISTYIIRLVWGGFNTKDDIRDDAVYQTQPPVQAKADLAWIDQQLNQEWSKKRAAEATWPVRIDFNRLDDVFKMLRTKGIIALHNAGNTQTDARDDASEEWHRLGGPKSGLQGFIFYHGQDVEHVIADGELHIGFSTFPEGASPALELARQTALELKQAGFAVTPPPDVDTRILITGIDWKKRSPK